MKRFVWFRFFLSDNREMILQYHQYHLQLWNYNKSNQQYEHFVEEYNEELEK
jgi:hypothetical protein